MHVWLLTFAEDTSMQSLHMTVDGMMEYIVECTEGMLEKGSVTVEPVELREDYSRFETELGDFYAELKVVGR